MAPSVVHWARRLTLSARRGEAEAGALMLRLLFHRAYLLLPTPSNDGSSGSSDLLSLLLGEEEEGGQLQEGDGGRVGYLRGLRRLVERRLGGFERGMKAWGAGEGQGRGEGIVMVFGAIQVRACMRVDTAQLALEGRMYAFYPHTHTTMTTTTIGGPLRPGGGVCCCGGGGWRCWGRRSLGPRSGIAAGADGAGDGGK